MKVQGRYDADNWVIAFKIKISEDGSEWSPLYPISTTQMYQNSSIVFAGSLDRNTITEIMFSGYIRSKMIRIEPVKINGDRACMRFDAFYYDNIDPGIF